MVPITDWIELYNLSDPLLQQYHKELFRGNPKQKKDLYIDRSPITHISKIKAPVMIMAAKNDSTCPIEPIEKFINILKEMNHPHEFIIEENAGHVSYYCEKNIQISIKVIDFIKRNLS
jgi:dipeptidyl aminopeptidase/acylaminoacyl peptidase